MRGGLTLVRGRAAGPESRLALRLVIATMPAIAVGADIAAADLADALRDIRVIGWTMIVFGIVL